MSEPHKSVTVSIDGDEFITIETNCLFGGEIGGREEDAIRWAIDHLSAFIADRRYRGTQPYLSRNSAAAYRAGRIAQAEEDAVGVLTVKPAFISGFPDVTETLNRAAAAIRANIAKLKNEDSSHEIP